MSATAPLASSTLGSMRPDGSRLKMHPADVHGRWNRRRRVVFAGLLAVYLLAPLVEIGGHPALQLDVQHRRFYLLGQTFNAQDVWLVVLLGLGFAFSLLFVTAWRGRVWCGWACPQTVFLEGLYRPIERLIDGSREQRLRLDAAPWTAGKLGRRALKLTLFALLSIAIAHTATALFVSPRELWLMITEGPAAHLEAFALTTGFSLVLFFNFTWFREQFCVVLCPYGRLQSVLHDRRSVTVAYDERRGEPRGHVAKESLATAPPRGDCVDCRRCVVVCPTGIDIRNGLQMECLACTQCVDACDEVMVKVGRPQGLIRFASVDQLERRPPTRWSPRLASYAALAVLSLGTLGFSLARRQPFEANVVRPAGASPWFVDAAAGRIRNAFEVHLVNKHPERGTFRLRVVGADAADVVIGTPVVTLDSLGDARVPLVISVARGAVVPELTLEIVDELGGDIGRRPIRFIAPR
ncbi:MAG: cytochrome c oxidase accessory protein CcoG [Archangium sp.]|nr:cytochrome c oxidase accessory protein CcoG [Archangium sp.]